MWRLIMDTPAPLLPTPSSSQWLEQLLEQTTEFALVRLDPSGVIDEWLGAAPTLFGWSRSEAVGKPYAALFTPADRSIGMDATEVSLALVKGRSEDDRWHVRKDQSVFWGSGAIEAIRDDSGSLLGFCKLVRDRTDLRVRTKALENRVAADEARRAALGLQMEQLAQRLRSPLEAIRAVRSPLVEGEHM